MCLHVCTVCMHMCTMCNVSHWNCTLALPTMPHCPTTLHSTLAATLPYYALPWLRHNATLRSTLAPSHCDTTLYPGSATLPHYALPGSATLPHYALPRLRHTATLHSTTLCHTLRYSGMALSMSVWVYLVQQQGLVTV